MEIIRVAMSLILWDRRSEKNGFTEADAFSSKLQNVDPQNEIGITPAKHSSTSGFAW